MATANFIFDTQKISEALINMADKEIDKYEFEEYPDYLFEMLDYLPELFQDDSEKKYIESISLAMQTSYQNKLYQFAYVQYHMTFMTAIYFVLLKVSWFYENDFKEALYYLIKDRYNDFFNAGNTKDGKLYFGSFAVINESDVFMLLKIIEMDSDLEGQLKPFVKERNRYAHANGALLLTSEELFEEKLIEYNAKIRKVFSLLKVDILKLYKNLLQDANFYNPDIRAYIEPDIQVQEEFIRKFSLSRVELNWCRKYDIKEISDHRDYEQIIELHIELCKYYKSLAEDE